MSDLWPDLTFNVVIDLDDEFNFVNVADPSKPTSLKITATERTTVVFTLADRLLQAGWLFQETPFNVTNDYGVNFSSFGWLQAAPTMFRVVFECRRPGVYEYTLLLTDSNLQKLSIDPKIENGPGWNMSSPA